MDPQAETQNETVIRDVYGSKNNSSIPLLYFIIVIVVVIGLGVTAGYFTGRAKVNSTGPAGQKTTESGKQSEGVLDKKRFPDTAEGLLKDGGIDGEGSFHLERPGGASQSVYLTSSIVDLSKYLNKRVKVWGETQKAQKAGWLMDVGYVEKL